MPVTAREVKAAPKDVSNVPTSLLPCQPGLHKPSTLGGPAMFARKGGCTGKVSRIGKMAIIMEMFYIIGHTPNIYISARYFAASC